MAVITYYRKPINPRLEGMVDSPRVNPGLSADDVLVRDGDVPRPVQHTHTFEAVANTSQVITTSPVVMLLDEELHNSGAFSLNTGTGEITVLRKGRMVIDIRETAGSEGAGRFRIVNEALLNAVPVRAGFQHAALSGGQIRGYYSWGWNAPNTALNRLLYTAGLVVQGTGNGAYGYPMPYPGSIIELDANVDINAIVSADCHFRVYKESSYFTGCECKVTSPVVANRQPATATFTPGRFTFLKGERLVMYRNRVGTSMTTDDMLVNMVVLFDI